MKKKDIKETPILLDKEDLQLMLETEKAQEAQRSYERFIVKSTMKKHEELVNDAFEKHEKLWDHLKKKYGFQSEEGVYSIDQDAEFVIVRNLNFSKPRAEKGEKSKL